MIKRAISARWTVALLLVATLACAVPSAAQTTGETELSLQSYYSAGDQQPMANTAGASVAFRDFIPHFGLLKGSFQGWSDRGDFRGGDNFLELSGAAFLGRHWTVGGGDFRATTQLVRNPFVNVYTPDLNARGFRLQVGGENRTYSFFVGGETLLQGPRIPFRMRVPQRVLGASMQQTIGPRWQVGIRYLHLWADDTQSKPLFLSVGKKFDAVDIVTVQSLYTVRKHLKFYGEMAESTVSGEGDAGPKQPVSVFFGPAWESEKLTARANYVYQNAAYLPLPGFLAGDRRGPFAEVQYRPRRSVALHASASRYSNNLDHDPRVPTLHSSGYGSGLSWSLPWKLSASADVNVIRLRQTGGEVSSEEPASRQVMLSVSRPVWRQTLRFSLLDLNVTKAGKTEKQRSVEFEDTLVWRRFVFAGAMRMQRAQDQTTRNTLFFRGSAQMNVRRASAYAQVQKGSDLLSQSLFATSSFSSTVFGLDAPLLKGARLQVEAFRNQMTSTLNPASIFVLQNRGADIPATLAGFNQWSVYTRVSRQFQWGRGGGDLSTSAPQVPLVGAIEGKVSVSAAASASEIAGIPITLDNGRIARTDIQGRYKFIDVPEGVHEVKLAVRELPAEFEPGEPSLTSVKVLPRAIARADFCVQRLTSLAGKVIVPPGMPPDSIVIRLLPTARYTTPDADGSFGFYNLPEGEYQVAIDMQTLPEESELESAPSQKISVRADQPGPTPEFQIAPHVQEKPVRVLFQQEIRTNNRQK